MYVYVITYGTAVEVFRNYEKAKAAYLIMINEDREFSKIIGDSMDRVEKEDREVYYRNQYRKGGKTEVRFYKEKVQ